MLLMSLVFLVLFCVGWLLVFVSFDELCFDKKLFYDFCDLVWVSFWKIKILGLCVEDVKKMLLVVVKGEYNGLMMVFFFMIWDIYFDKLFIDMMDLSNVFFFVLDEFRVNLKIV